MPSLPSPSSLAMFAILALAAFAFVAGAMLWLKRLRQNLARTVGEALTRQIQHGQKVEEALIALQRNQRQMENQMQTLAHAHAKMRADLNALYHKIENRETLAESTSSQGRVIH